MNSDGTIYRVWGSNIYYCLTLQHATGPLPKKGPLWLGRANGSPPAWYVDDDGNTCKTTLTGRSPLFECTGGGRTGQWPAWRSTT